MNNQPELDQVEITEIKADITSESSDRLPIIFLEEGVLFPGNVVPVTARDGLKEQDIEDAKSGHLRIGVVSRSNGESYSIDLEPGGMKAASTGTEAIVVGLMKLADDQFGVVLRGLRRFVIEDIQFSDGNVTAKVEVFEDLPSDKDAAFLGQSKALKSSILKVLKQNPSISQETAAAIYTSDEPAYLINLIAPFLSLSTQEKQSLLEERSLTERMKIVLKALAGEVELLGISNRIQEEVKGDIQDNMRKGFLREQMTAIKRELNELDGQSDDFEDLYQELSKKNMPQEAKDACLKELKRLEMMHPGSPEYMVSWNYLSLFKELPWSEGEEKDYSSRAFSETKKILESAHYGLDKVKERFLEYVALLNRRGEPKGEVLLLAGPPGVGKTSLAKSIAEALGRPFQRVSLGGVKDEAEIRGHRRTYIGAMPGKLITAINQAGMSAPVILLDEIDKVSSGPSGDTASALLEILDPEQNKKFTDHYLGVPYDFSKVIFIATANNLETISRPLLDRMEVVELSGYTEMEKLGIAKSHLLPGVLNDHVLNKKDLKISDEAIKQITRYYTREAGVRQLKQSLSKIARKAVSRLAIHESESNTPANKKSSNKKPGPKPIKVAKPLTFSVSSANLAEWLGIPPILPEPKVKKVGPGIVTGMAYTSVGGDILFIETSLEESEQASGKLKLTGNIGKVMQESAFAARSFLTTISDELSIEPGRVQKSDIHMHIPEGAVPKDGPSAGVAVFCALASTFLGKPVPSSFAMTGEATLRGQILAVGGIKEKVLAAHRYGKRQIIVPASNWYDLEELPQSVLKDLTIYPLSRMQDALKVTGLLPTVKSSKDLGLKYEKLGSFANLPMSSFRVDRIGLQSRP